jgi:predicted RNA methylase
MYAKKLLFEDLSSIKFKMRTTPYHFNLLSDEERLSAFFEAIKEKCNGTVYDIGSGCGILSIFASFYSDFVYAVEINPDSAKTAKYNTKLFKNISLINADAREMVFKDKADFIICEMLDTALIDEEQVPVINSILKNLKDSGEIIPKGIINGAEAVNMDSNHICYDDSFAGSNLNHEIISNFVIYNEVNFNMKIDEDVEAIIEFKISKKGIMTGIKITTLSLLTENIICGPTEMFNPPLLIPIPKINVDIRDRVKIKLSYKMGGGLDSIRTKIEGIS